METGVIKENGVAVLKANHSTVEVKQAVRLYCKRKALDLNIPLKEYVEKKLLADNDESIFHQ